MNWLQTILALLQLAPSILQTVASVQAIVTTPKQGALKKAIVMHAVAGAAPELQTAVSAFVDASVTTLKEAGALKSPVPAAQ